MQPRYILISGGAGFVGTNVARSYLESGQPVHIFDNFSRPGVSANVAELQHRYPRQLLVTKADIQDSSEIVRAVESASAVYHFAAQVAVTTSLVDPVGDLETNLMGTIRLLEAIRSSGSFCPLLFTSTNKVYGKLAGISLQTSGSRWVPEDPALALQGIAEDQPLEFMSPYGCSKGSADQYVLDYARSFHLPATVFRMSCIYGPYQLGSEDQGWVAHFLRQAMKREPIAIFGDGKQVRDLLFVEDLVCAMRMAQENMDSVSGEAFNVGGGEANSTSLLDVLNDISDLLGYTVDVEWRPERVADQKWFVANTAKLQQHLKWCPTTNNRTGLRALRDWYLERPALVAQTEVQVA